MRLIHFIQPGGSEIAAIASVGESVMQAAVNHQVPGIPR
jgi:2Fe-2S ferredoxin